MSGGCPRGSCLRLVLSCPSQALKGEGLRSPRMSLTTLNWVSDTAALLPRVHQRKQEPKNACASRTDSHYSGKPRAEDTSPPAQNHCLRKIWVLTTKPGVTRQEFPDSCDHLPSETNRPHFLTTGPHHKHWNNFQSHIKGAESFLSLFPEGLAPRVEIGLSTRQHGTPSPGLVKISRS